MKKVFKLFLMICMLLLSSCDSVEYDIYDTYSPNIFAEDGFVVTPFNTSVSLRTFCEKDHNNVSDLFVDEITRLHKLFDRYNYYKEDNVRINNLKILNDSYGKDPLVYDQDLIDLINLSIDLSVLTEGYFNPTLGCLIDKWNTFEKDGETFSRFSPYCYEGIDITNEDLSYGMDRIIPYTELRNYIIIDDEKNTIEFKKYNDLNNVIISVGAIAKGYAIEKVKTKVEKFNIPAMIDGGTSSTYGLGSNPNPERDYWLIGLSSPYKNFFQQPAIANLCFNDTYTLSVSGDYESCFYFMDENNNKVLRHHLLNPYTGYSENYCRVLALKSNKRSDVLDGLSTALFNIESTDKILEIIENVEEFFDMEIAILIEKEVDSENKKIDFYLDKEFKSYINAYNNTYVNKEHIIDIEE